MQNSAHNFSRLHHPLSSKSLAYAERSFLATLTTLFASVFGIIMLSFHEAFFVLLIQICLSSLILMRSPQSTRLSVRLFKHWQENSAPGQISYSDEKITFISLLGLLIITTVTVACVVTTIHIYVNICWPKFVSLKICACTFYWRPRLIRIWWYGSCADRLSPTI